MRADNHKHSDAELNEEQREAIQHIKAEFGAGYYLVLLPGGRFEGQPATHVVISKKNFAYLAKRARKA